MQKSAEIYSEEYVMRLRVIALLAAVFGLVLIPVTAEAGHRRHHHHHYEYNHRGWAESYTPSYHRHYRSDWRYDPYRYSASPRGYYPYYNSGYWRPTHELRYRLDHYRPYAGLPPYYRAWGHPTKRPVHYRKYRQRRLK
jgi:hypothetical protein